MSRHTEEFLDRLAAVLPALAQTWEEQQRLHGDQASRAFLRAATQLTAGRYLSGDPEAAKEFPALAEFLETEFGSDQEIDALIAGSFLANLPRPDDPRAGVTDRIGPKLRAELELQRRGAGIPVASPAVDAIHRLAGADATFAEDLREHLEFYEELLPHVLLSEVSARLVEDLETGEVASVRPVLAAIDAEFGKDYEVDELIAASFVENLPYPGDEGSGILDLLGPNLRKELRRQRSS